MNPHISGLPKAKGQKPGTPKKGDSVDPIADQVEQNTPASKADQSIDDSRGAHWNQLDVAASEAPMPPRARVPPKAKPMSEPKGAVAQKPGGPGDVLFFESARAEAAKKAAKAAFWKKAYEAKLRAEHGWRLGFGRQSSRRAHGREEDEVPEMARPCLLAYIVIAYVVMTCIVMTYIVMTRIVSACIVMYGL